MSKQPLTVNPDLPTHEFRSDAGELADSDLEQVVGGLARPLVEPPSLDECDVMLTDY